MRIKSRLLVAGLALASSLLVLGYPASADTTNACVGTGHACLTTRADVAGVPTGVLGGTVTGTGMLTVAAVAAHLGLSKQTVRSWCRAGIIPTRRPAGTKKWLIPRDQFNRWLADCGGLVRDFATGTPRDTRPDEELLTDTGQYTLGAVARGPLTKENIDGRHP